MPHFEQNYPIVFKLSVQRLFQKGSFAQCTGSATRLTKAPFPPLMKLVAVQISRAELFSTD